MSTTVEVPSLARELVLASAGSGKTYGLSSRVIELLALGVPAGEVLASTFTRKAAGEILDRVLLRVAEGASDEEKAGKLGDDAHPSLADPAACRALLARLLSDLQQLNIGTLDAFLIRIARSFFQELGLAPGWTIADRPTHERLRAESVQAALGTADKEDLVELLRMLNQGDADRRVHDSLLDKVDDLLRIHRQLDPDALAPWSPDFGIANPMDPEKIAAQATELAAHLAAFDVPLTKAGKPSSDWVKAREKAAVAIAANDWGNAFGQGIGAKLLAEKDEYSGAAIPEEFLEVFEKALVLARHDLATKLRRQSEALGRLAELLNEAFIRVQRRSGAYRFEDITYLLGGPDPTGSRLDLHYRLDQQIRHLLLDEFQDTSLEQWRALEPLADELLSGYLDERAGVIVADTKQSIYGWRGARPELVHQVGERYVLTKETMDRSWRSSPVVLEILADIFRKLSSNAVITAIDVGPPVASSWMEDFTEIQAARDLPGYACVHVTPADDGRRALRPNLLKRAAQIIKDLQEQTPDRTIGVLVRRNVVVGQLMKELRALGIRASGEGGTSLTDTPPVNAVLSLMRLADHPSDRAAAYHVATTPLGGVVDFSDWKGSAGTKAAGALAARVRAELLSDGYGPTLAKWVQALGPKCDVGEVRRLLQLVELGHRWDDRPSLRPSDFVRNVSSESVEDPSSALVKVMTVHRSKGLEFDVVVLPELYASMAPRGGGVVTPVRAPSGKVTQVYAGVSKKLRAFFPQMERANSAVRAAEFRDALSVLYVALSRAKYALHLIVPPATDPKKTQPKSSAQLIRGSLGLLEDPQGLDDDGGVLVERGDPDWFEKLESVPTPASEEPAADPAAGAGEPPQPSGALLRTTRRGAGRNLARRSPSSLEGGSHVDLAQALSLESSFARRRGTIVHAWCEAIEWANDGIPENATLRALAAHAAIGMTGKQLSRILSDFNAWMENDSIRSVLSRFAYPSEPGTTVRVENELPFVRRIGDEIQEGFIDRLVLIEREGKIVAAEVLDFKTDGIDSADDAALAAKADYYRPQIEAYCDVVRGQYGLPEGAVTGKLIFLAAGAVTAVV